MLYYVFSLFVIILPLFLSQNDVINEPVRKGKLSTFSQPLPLPLWNNQQILLYFGLYSGLTNQRITLLNAAFFARMTGMKLILPQWKFDFSDYIGGTLFPFDYVLNFDPVKLQKQLGISTISTMPTEFTNECFSQLMYTHGRASYGVASTTTYMSIDAALLIAKKRGRVCRIQ